MYLPLIVLYVPAYCPNLEVGDRTANTNQLVWSWVQRGDEVPFTIRDGSGGTIVNAQWPEVHVKQGMHILFG